jgi:hypothetical protein
MNDCEIMRQIDSEYQRLSGFRSSRDYKIFNSHIHPFPLLILGWNPGGRSDGTDLSASRTYFEAWEHDYVCFRKDTNYAIAARMCGLLERCLNTGSINALRQVPVTNLIFRRSPESKALRYPETEIAKSRPGLETIIRHVNPDVLLILGIKTYDQFVKFHCSDVQEEPEATLFSRNGRDRIYVRATGAVNCLSRRLTMLSIAHPTGYRWPNELWRKATHILQGDFAQAGLSPIEKSGRLVNLPILPDQWIIEPGKRIAGLRY